MNDILTAVGNIITGALVWVGQYATCVTSTPLILFFICIPIVGLGIGLLRRLMGL